MSEKKSEVELGIILDKESFNPSFLYYTLSNEILKDLFKTASKKENGLFGIPDRIYFDGTTIIIFECKKSSLRLAEKDIRYYMDSVKDSEYKIYGVAFVHTSCYSIFKVDYGTIIELPNTILQLQTFKLQDTFTIDMRKEIHTIHNYIRDYTKISNEDKPLFIAVILIGLKNNVFNSLLDSIDSKECIYSILETILQEYNIDVNVFKPIITNEDKEHLYNLIQMVTTIYNKRPNIDLLNEFYNEFVRYNNIDGKSLGIVLTPPHIVKLMCELLSIQSDDTVLDLCTGTGSFLLEAYTYHPKKIIGCEYQNKLFALLKCNMIIRNIQNYDIIQGNCFEHTFKATKSLINPPYSMKDKSELEFILKQLESIDENGEACAIIPMSKISNSTKNTEHKSQILEIAHVKTIIVCRDTLFYPTASVHCVILHFIKSKKENRTNNETSILYYEDDGFDMIRQQGLMKNDTFEEKFIDILNKCKEYMLNKVELNGEDDWVELDHTDSHDISELELKLYELELDYMEKKKQIVSSFVPPSILPETKKIKLLDIFEIVKGPSRKLKDYESNGTYNIISSIDNNNGIHASKYATHKDYEPHCLTLNKNGSVGYCYYQSSPFVKTCDVIVLKSIQPMTKNAYIYFAIKITKVCTKRYSYSYKINQHRIQRILLDVPVTKDNEIDYQYIESII